MSKKRQNKRKVQTGCQFCNRDVRNTTAFPLFGGRCCVPVCTQCVADFRRRGVSITEYFEAEIVRYVAEEPAFWHPGDRLPEIAIKEEQG